MPVCMGKGFRSTRVLPCFDLGRAVGWHWEGHRLRFAKDLFVISSTIPEYFSVIKFHASNLRAQGENLVSDRPHIEVQSVSG